MTLQRRLGTLEVFSISAGAMISSGLFILPGLAFALSGPAVFLAYLLAGILIIPALLGKAELVTAMPKSGGIYFYVERSMGAALGTLGGLGAWFSLSFKSAFALVGIGAFTALLFPGMSELELRLVAAGFCIVFTAVNLVGVHHAGRAQVVMVLGLIVILVIYAAVGLGEVEARRFQPFMPEGWGGLLATTGLVFVSFGGLTKAASVAEEVRNPGRDLPRGMFLAFGVVLVLYVLVTIATVGLVDPDALASTLTPLNLGARPILGTVGVVAVTVAAILAFISTGNAGIMAASRVPMAMSRDALLPNVLGGVHAKRGTPTLAILVTGGFMTAVILLLDLETLVKTASTLKLLLFVLANVSVILMRESRIESYRPAFRTPFYPWLLIAGIVAYVVLIAAMGIGPILLSGAFVALSLGWYAFYGRRAKSERTAAVVHVVERIAGRDLEDRSLRTELTGILQERDGIEEDRFDRLISSCEILEVSGKPSLESFLADAAAHLADEVGIPASELADLLLERERDTSTAITAHVTIPHAVIAGSSGKFHILVARCKEGVVFSDTSEDITAIFLLVGSEDERHFHLRALMAIAELVQAPDFHERWQGASSPEDLRDLLLLSVRRRHAD